MNSWCLDNVLPPPAAMNRDEEQVSFLKPQWLKPASASSHSVANEHSNGTLSRSRSALNAASAADHSQGLRRLSSSLSAPYTRSVSSNGSVGHDRGYSSFGRSHRDRERNRDRDRDRNRDRDRDRERDSVLDNGYCDYSDPIRSTRAERDLPRRSLSLVVGVPVGPPVPRRPVSTLSNGVGSSSVASFDKEFPSLGAEDKAGMSDVGRVNTPAFATGIQSPLPGLSDGWTSALVEAPGRVRSNGAQVSSGVQTAASMTSVASSTSTGLSMAAALTQAPARAHMAPQLTNDSERKKEKELMHLGKLVPVIAKGPIHNSAEKSKSKGAKSFDYISPKIGLQSSSQPVNHALRVPVTTVDAPKVSQCSNYQVLNWDKNGVDSTAKDGPTLRTSSRDAPSVGVSVQAAPGHHLPSTANSKLKVNGKVGGERKPLSQVQGRHDFFNSIRKKEMSRNSSAANLEAECVASPSSSLSTSSASNSVAQSCKHITGASASQEDIPSVSTSNAECSLVENGNNGTCDGKFETLPPPDEKEAAFLQSLGWEENAVVEPISQEEIAYFLNKYSKHSACTKLKALFPELLQGCSS